MSKINFQSKLGFLGNQLVDLYEKLGESDEQFEISDLIRTNSTILTQNHSRGLFRVVKHVLNHKKNQIKHPNLLKMETLEFMLKSRIRFFIKIKHQTYKNRNLNRIMCEQPNLFLRILEQNQEKLKDYFLRGKHLSSVGCGWVKTEYFCLLGLKTLIH